jgi:RND family efflux transporter MFP subunit
MLKNRRIYWSLLAVTVGFSAGCGGKKPADTKSATPVSVAVQVSTAPAVTGSIQQTAFVTGTLTALNDVTVGAKSAGRLVGLYKREGDTVTAGEIVAQIDPTDAQAQLRQASAALAQQEANVAAAQAKQQQAEVAYQNSLTTLSITRTQTASAVQQAQASLNSAQQQYAIVVKGARVQQRKEAAAQVASARASLKNAQDNLHRYEQLYRENAVSAQDLDTAQTTFDTANANYNSAVQAYDLLQVGARPEEIQQAKDALTQAKEALLQQQANASQVQMRQEDVRNAQQSITAAKAAVLQAQAAVTQAQAARDYAATQLKDTSIVTPITGVVATRNAQVGQQLGAGGAILQIVSLHDIYFDAQLPESQFAAVSVGMPVDVTVDALPGKHVTGTIHKLFPVASAGARAFTVRIALPDGTPGLRPQMFARGNIVLAVHRNTVLIPREAAMNVNGNKATVFVVHGKKAAQENVELGFFNPQSYEVLKGVQSGDKVVTIGQGEIQDGTPVDIVSGS